MIYPQIPNLLRRTTAAIAAIAGLMLAADSQAAQISLSTGGNCTYSSMNVTPAGDFNVTCAGAVAGPTTVAITAASIQMGTTGQVATVSRSNATNGDITVAYSVPSGSACAVTGTQVSFAGSALTQTIPVTPMSVGTCRITLGDPAPSSGGTLSAPGYVDINITAAGGGGGGGGGGNGAGCPTPPVDMFAGTVFDAPGSNTTITLVSRQIASYTLPNEPWMNRSSATIGIGETTGTVAGSFLEVTVSKCKGVIDPTAGSCYFGSYTQAWNEMTWFFQTGPYSLAAITARNYCYAPKLDSTGNPQTWYFNVRWTYPFSQWGFGRYVFAPAVGPY